jgi:hypothetical protein
MTNESSAHADYKARLCDAQDTILTELFGLGWPAAHRVIPNEATGRWLKRDDRGPSWLRGVNRAATEAIARAPAGSQSRLVGGLAGLQRAAVPLFSPAAAAVDAPPTLIEAGPLYAGATVARIADIRPAGDLVRDLAAVSA